MDELKQKIKALIAEVMYVDVTNLKDDDVLFGDGSFADFDSIDFLSLAMGIKENFGIEIKGFQSEGVYHFANNKEELLKIVRTVNSIAEYITQYG
jgi:acyl carrier protein